MKMNQREKGNPLEQSRHTHDTFRTLQHKWISEILWLWLEICNGLEPNPLRAEKEQKQFLSPTVPNHFSSLFF
jgi:hypothetical protein